MKKLLRLQPAILLGGTIFAFYTVVEDFIRFYNYENTIFKLRDCVVPNPVITPCFYGAFAFLLAFFLSIKIFRTLDLAVQTKKQKHLLYLLVASVLFAWGNFFYTVYDYTQSIAAKADFTGCSGVLAENPLKTPCFYGALIFLTALITGLAIYNKMKNSEKPKENEPSKKRS